MALGKNLVYKHKVKLKLLRNISEVAAPGSVLILQFILQFMEDLENNSSAALSTAKATSILEEWLEQSGIFKIW